MSQSIGATSAGRGRSGPSGRTRILLSVPAAEAGAFFPPDTRRALAALGEVREIEPKELMTTESFRAGAEGVQVLVTAWGFPRLDAARLAAAPDLRFVMHAASSLHALVGDDFWATGIPVSQAGAAMAPAVAELSLTFTLSLLRRTHRLDHALRSGASWQAAREVERAREIGGAVIGVVGASRTGRRYIEACRALGADVMVYDPYVAETDPLGPFCVTLPELLASSDVVALHAPATDETRGLIGAAEIAAIRDGGLFVNTARPSIVDMDALYDAVASGRIDAALDVFDAEPLPGGDRWRALPNVLLTPHLAGATADSRRRAGRIVVDEVRRHLRGEPLVHTLSRADLERMG
ncbi:hydroxyacid dehydrogenase [Streptomyces sp. NBC_01336]|uniref:hydroxyacid dehydrogenase n=1 Tax=Streptomyces sp. NBC_01336 TaxID=2903829 RepID=UPI002E130F66|nr:hydroxyacid dehydrogenase [Streptomyces sp. NBC_01336]